MNRTVASLALLWCSLAPSALWAAAAQLKIVHATLHDRKEDGPRIPAGYEYRSGELLYVSFRIAGYAVQKDNVNLRYQIVATDPEGLLLLEPLSGGVQAEVNFNDKEWLPKVAETLPLPPQLAPGSYRLKLRATDEFGKTSAEETLEFRVGGRAKPGAENLVIRDVAFLSSADDTTPMPQPEYFPGSSVFLTFELAGFKLGPKNAFDVQCGITVLRPSGKVLYEEPQAAADKGTPYYPKRYLNGAFSLNLSGDLTPGEYTLVLKAVDSVGGQTAESRHTFTVRKQ